MVIMKTRAVRLYGKKDLRLEEFELPDMQDDEILAEVMTDSLCMSTLKAVDNGADHKKVPDDVATHPVILGHEFCGRILKVGAAWKDKYQEGEHFVIQPNIGDPRSYAPGYSFPYAGGDATKILFHAQVMKNGSLLPYAGKAWFEGSLVEPLSCVTGAFHTNYHLRNQYSHEHIMGIRNHGNMALLGATGPMGFLAIDLAIHGDKRPHRLVVTGHTQAKLELTRQLYPESEAAAYGVELHYVNTRDMDDFSAPLKALLPEGEGFDDVFVFVADKTMSTQAVRCLGKDGCLNFFAGPLDKNFSAEMNFFDVHYNTTHLVGNSGGNTDDMKEAISLIEHGTVQANKIVSHIMGLDQVVDSTLQLRSLSAGKKVVYTHFDMPRYSTKEIMKGAMGPELAALVERHDGFWNAEAEAYLLAHHEAY